MLIDEKHRNYRYQNDNGTLEEQPNKILELHLGHQILENYHI